MRHTALTLLAFLLTLTHTPTPAPAQGKLVVTNRANAVSFRHGPRRTMRWKTDTRRQAKARPAAARPRGATFRHR